LLSGINNKTINACHSKCSSKAVGRPCTLQSKQTGAWKAAALLLPSSPTTQHSRVPSKHVVTARPICIYQRTDGHSPYLPVSQGTVGVLELAYVSQTSMPMQKCLHWGRSSTPAVHQGVVQGLQGTQRLQQRQCHCRIAGCFNTTQHCQYLNVDCSRVATLSSLLSSSSQHPNFHHPRQLSPSTSRLLTAHQHPPCLNPTSLTFLQDRVCSGCAAPGND
jgi:hypothetical protein